MKLGLPYPLRRKTIDDLISSEPKRTMEIDFKNVKNMIIPIVTLSIELPKYRLANGRTYDLQIEYLAKNTSLPNDFFEKDPELESVQSVQHGLLKKLVGKKKDLLEYFSEHEQGETLILNQDGFVINGNRRLCAMRELLLKDPVKYKHFKNIDCAILPPATEEDIDDLEARLQEHPDIKAPYTWTSRVLMYKKKKELYNYSDEVLAEKYETTEQEIKLLYSMLASADKYLNRIGKDRQYHIVSDDQFSFRQIALNRKNIPDAVDRDLFEVISFTLIENSETVGGRVYEKIPGVKKHLDRIKTEIKNEFKIRKKSENIKKLSQLGKAMDGRDNISPIVDDPTNTNDIKNIVIEVFESERTKRRENKKKNIAIYLLEKADENLSEAVTKFNTIGPSKLRNIKSLTDSIQVSVNKIRDWLSDNNYH